MNKLEISKVSFLQKIVPSEEEKILIFQYKKEIEILKEENHQLKLKISEITKKNTFLDNEINFSTKVKKVYKKRVKEPNEISLNEIIEEDLNRMILHSRVDYYRLKMILEKHLTLTEKQVYEFILQRTVKLKKGFSFITCKEILEGSKYGKTIFTQATNLSEKTIRNVIKSLQIKKLIFVHKVKSNKALYILNIEKGKELLAELESNKINLIDIEEFSSEISKGKSFFDLVFNSENITSIYRKNYHIERKILPLDMVNITTSKIAENIVEYNFKTNQEFSPIELPKEANNILYESRLIDANFHIKDDIRQRKKLYLIKLLTEAEYKGKKINFREDLAKILVEKYYEESINIEEIIKNQINLINYKKNLENYNLAGILYKAIEKNILSQVNISIFKDKKREINESEILKEKYFPAISVWEEISNHRKKSHFTEYELRLILSRLLEESHAKISHQENSEELKNDIRRSFHIKIKETLKYIKLEECFNDDCKYKEIAINDIKNEYRIVFGEII